MSVSDGFLGWFCSHALGLVLFSYESGESKREGENTVLNTFGFSSASSSRSTSTESESSYRYD